MPSAAPFFLDYELYCRCLSKKLIRKVQCRLKLLKNKRSTIVRQLRDDLAQLLKHGHHHTAFDRVDQLYRDESLVEVYDLLETFCEFILINLPYIRRHKDCPNDINEAMSSLIFASARFGDFPELISIRKLFGDRYGHRFANTALELLPGNLVNRQIQEKLCIKSVPDDVKNRLIVEIDRSALKSGPLLIEYSSELQQKQHVGNKTTIDPILCIEPRYDENVVQNSEDPKSLEWEKEVVYVDFPYGSSKKFLKDLFPSFLSTKAIFPSRYSSIVKQGSINKVEKKFEQREVTFSGLEKIEERAPDAALESSSESWEKLPEETIYLDDIQEFKSPVRKEGSVDQRVFMFKPYVLPLRGKIDNANDRDPKERAATRSFRKNKKVSSGERLRRRSVSIGIASVKDVECAIYYGESLDDDSSNYDKKSHNNNKGKNHRNISRKFHHHQEQESLDQPRFVKFSSRCSLENSEDWHCSPNYVPKIECELRYKQCSSNQYRDMVQETEECVIRDTKSKKGYTRAMTMPIERPNDQEGISDNVRRTNSLPVEEHGRWNSNRHVHPKLPDYDELAAKFMALKKASLKKFEKQ